MSESGFFNLAGPPRTVPFLVRLRVLFGGGANQLGWLLFGLGTITAWFFVDRVDYNFWKFYGELEAGQAVVVKTEESSSSWSGRKSSNSKAEPVHAIFFAFTPLQGSTAEFVSYTGEHKLQAGDKVDVEYPSGRVDLVRIKGMRRKRMPTVILLILVFPLGGLGLFIVGFCTGFQGLGLMVGGIQGKAKLKSKKKTDSKVLGKTVYDMILEFQAEDDQMYEIPVHTHHPERFEDESGEPLLYAPTRPSQAVLLDALPGSPRIDKTGNIQAKNPLASIGALILPVVVIVGNVIMIITKLRQ